MQVKRTSHVAHHHQANSASKTKVQTDTDKKGQTTTKLETDLSLDSLLDMLSETVSDDSGFEMSEEDCPEFPDFEQMGKFMDSKNVDGKNFGKGFMAQHKHANENSESIGEDFPPPPDFEHNNSTGSERVGRRGFMPPPPKPEMLEKLQEYLDSKETDDSDSADVNKITDLLQQLLNVLKSIKTASTEKTADTTQSTENKSTKKDNIADLFQQLFALLEDSDEDDDSNNLKELLLMLTPKRPKPEDNKQATSNNVIS